MNRSSSRGELPPYDMMKDSGIDLSEYKQQLARERNARTLTLRKLSRPAMKNVFGGGVPRGKSRVSLSSDKAATIQSAVSTLTSNNESSIAPFCSSILEADGMHMSHVNALAKSPEVANAFYEALSAGYGPSTVIALLGAVSMVFPFSGENDVAFVDTGICFLMPEFLDNDGLVNATVTMIGALSESSGYARDSVLCMELHITLCTLAQTSDNVELVMNICEALRKIFANPSEIDFQILSDSVVPMTPLLELSCIPALHSIISAMTEMACKMSTLVLKYNEVGIYLKVITFLQNADLTDVSLKLIGVLSVGQPSHVLSMLDSGVLNILMDLLRTEYCADVFWIFTNLIETLQTPVLELFDSNFLASVVELASSASFEVKKEASFFLSTYALFAGADTINAFLNDEIIEIFVEILGCGVSIVLLRIIDSLVRMLQQVQIGNAPVDFISILESSDLRKRLGEATEQSFTLVAERAEYLIGIMDAIEKSE